MNTENKINNDLGHCVKEHDEIGQKIKESSSQVNFNQILVQKMKRQQSELRNKIAYLQSLLLEDIVA